jgi:hypothetical protein
LPRTAFQFILAVALGASFGLHAAMQGSASDSLLKTNRRPKKVDHETLKRNITETMESIESLAQQLKSAKPSEVAELRASGRRDFGISKSYVNSVLDSANYLIKAFASEATVKDDEAQLKGLPPESPIEKKLMKKLAKDQEKAKDLREEARDAVRGLHKSESEDYLQSVRNWILISEGSLRHDHPVKTIGE